MDTGIFPDSWKYANVQPVHKKNRFRPCLLSSKSTEFIIKKKSGFRPGIQLYISITSNIYESFEKYDETRAIFLDISKAFDKVWHGGEYIN